MQYNMHQKVLFKHCDPAGIVFYPRYFEMMNDCVEAFFDDALQTPFETLHAQGGVPTAQIQTRFAAPSRHGDQLILSLSITKIGGSAADYRLTAHCDGQLRFETTATLVNVNAAGRPIKWADEIRSKFESFKESHL